MSASTNRQIRLAARPHGAIKDSDWDHHDEPLPELQDGELLGRTRFISLDPAMRGWLDDRPSYIPPVGIGEVMRAGTVVEVVESRNERFAPGDLLSGSFGVQEWAISDGRGVRKIDASVAPASAFLGALGMPGLTAYFGLVDVGEMKDGETVVISGAAGAVGTVAGQLAKQRGCRVVGIAGGPEKCAMVTDELGFDACIDYRSEKVSARLRELCPDGIDIYFDNVGGEILDAALANLARGARVVICGAISQYNAEGRPTGPANYMALLVRSAKMQGFVVFDYAKRYPEAFEALEEAARNGLVIKEHVVKGSIDDFPQTLQMLFSGANTGKLVLELG